MNVIIIILIVIIIYVPIPIQVRPTIIVKNNYRVEFYGGCNVSISTQVRPAVIVRNNHYVPKIFKLRLISTLKWCEIYWIYQNNIVENLGSISIACEFKCLLICHMRVCGYNLAYIFFGWNRWKGLMELITLKNSGRYLPN